MKHFILLMLLCFSTAVMAANNVTETSNGDMVTYDESYQNGNGEVADSPEIQKLRINNEFWYILLLSLLCIISLSIILVFIKLDKNHCAKDIVNAAGLTLIIFGTIILVLVVNTSEQLTAAIGILGAIAGYLFRSVQSDNNKTAGG